MAKFTFTGITDAYIASFCFKTGNQAQLKSTISQRLESLINAVGQTTYAVYSFEKGESFRHRTIQSLPKTSFENRFQTAEAFVKGNPAHRTIEQYYSLVEKSRRDALRKQFFNAGKRLGNCGILSMSVFANFIGTEGQRLRLANVPPEKPWTKRWWRELIWKNSDLSLRMPVLIIGTVPINTLKSQISI